MTDREPKIGDVIMEKRGGPWGHARLAVDAATINAARAWVASGRWVIVDQQPAAKTGPAADTSER